MTRAAFLPFGSPTTWHLLLRYMLLVDGSSTKFAPLLNQHVRFIQTRAEAVSYNPDRRRGTYQDQHPWTLAKRGSILTAAPAAETRLRFTIDLAFSL